MTSLTFLIVGVPAALFRFARRRHEAQLEVAQPVERIENWAWPRFRARRVVRTEVR